MARPIWSGSISFGLVNVPVKAYTAVRDHTVHFNQLEKDSGARIRNQKVSDKSGKPVDSDDIELGYEVKKGRYVTFEKGELDDLRPESTKAIDVTDFVALEDVDPIYYQRTYWLGPADKTGAEAYQLLLTAMEERERVAIGTVVMRNKQYLAAIRPLDGLLAMSTMRFADEVISKADISELPTRAKKVDAKSLKLALQIVDSLAGEWDPEQYHDTFTEQLQDIIHRKDKGKEAVIEETPSQTADVIDLMSALQASVDAAKKARSGKAARAALGKAAKAIAAEAEDEDDEKPTRHKASPSRKKAAPRKKAAAKKRAPAKATPARKSA